MTISAFARRCVPITLLAAGLAACGGGSSTSPASSPPARATASPTPAAVAGAQLTFTGQLAGTLTGLKGTSPLCGVNSGSATTFSAEAQGTLSGTPYRISVGVFDGYHGAGTYAIGLSNPATFTVGKPVTTTDPSGVTTTTTVAGFTGMGGTLVVNADQMSGTLDADLTAGDSVSTDSTKVAHVSGTWTCAGGS